MDTSPAAPRGKQETNKPSAHIILVHVCSVAFMEGLCTAKVTPDDKMKVINIISNALQLSRVTYCTTPAVRALALQILESVGAKADALKASSIATANIHQSVAQDLRIQFRATSVAAGLPHLGIQEGTPAARARQSQQALEDRYAEFTVTGKKGAEEVKMCRVIGLGPYPGSIAYPAQQTCAPDSLVVVGMLLSAGSTNIDRIHMNNPNTVFLPPAARFLDMMQVSWSTLEALESKQKKDSLIEALLMSRLSSNDKLLSFSSVWGVCSSALGQFYHRVTHHRACHDCLTSRFVPDLTFSNNPKAITTVQVTLVDRQQHFIQGIEQALSDRTRCWKRGANDRCPECKALQNSETTTIIEDALPPRLAIDICGCSFCPRRKNIDMSSHGEFQISYYALNKATQRIQKKISTMVWIGGVYQHAKHYRVYWRDNHDHYGGRGLICYQGNPGEVPSMFILPQEHAPSVPKPWCRTPDIQFVEVISTVTAGDCIYVPEDAIDPIDMYQEH